ncbi:MAG TPA: hypothetical protein VKZ18_18220 [Polyangia bacterium]|nr:hypothetical protein [Polyangia bacterium]
MTTASKHFRAARLALLLPLVTLGCSGGGSGSPQTVADFCTNYANAICQIATTPCGLTMDACTTYQTGQCMAMATAATTGTKRIFTPGNTGDCINKLKSAYGSTNPITPATMASINLACQYVFQGPGKTLTDSCTTQFDCAGATNGSIICDQAHNLCATSQTVSGTGQCGEVGDVCSANFYCAMNSSGVSLCTAAGTSTAASACNATMPCDSNSRCASGTCMPLVKAGEACGVDSDCASGGYCDHFGGSPTCDDGLLFSKGSQTCTCIATGVNCPTATATGTGGQGGSAVSGTAGQGGGAAAGSGGGAAGASGSAGASGKAGASGGAGAAGGAGGAGGA